MESPTTGSPVTSPPLNAVKKVFSNASSLSLRGRNAEDAGSLRGGLRGSADSALEKSPSRASQDSSREGSSVSGGSGIKKLIPGHAKRKRRRQREEAFEALEKERTNSDHLIPGPEPTQSSTNLSQDGNSLLTDDSEPDVPPPLLSRDSHTGYLTSSSPLITTTTVDGDHSEPKVIEPGLFQVPSTTSAFPETINISPKASPLFPASESTPVLPSTDLLDRADTLQLPSTNQSARRKSISSSFRGISPARRLKERFSTSKPDKSPRTSPEREFRDPLNGVANNAPSQTGSISERRQAKALDNPALTISDINVSNPNSFTLSNTNISSIDTKKRPQTPPGSALTTPLTTVTPPTPTENRSSTPPDSPRRNTTAPQSSSDGSGVVVSASGNMISHRRAKSQSSLSHQPSKLSNSILAPLTPTTEEVKTPAIRNSDTRNITPGGGFFSSWVSAAQNTVSTLTSTLNSQNRSRSATSGSEHEKLQPPEEKVDHSTSSEAEPETPKKQLAVETLGTGDLSFSHLGLDIVGSGEEKPPPPLRPDLEELRKNSTVRKDEAAAKIEDMLAKRAVSAAYGKDPPTPVAEVPDPMNIVKSSSSMSTVMGGDHNETNGSIFESETGSVRRNNSVRSRMAKRRSRGSSGATGTSAIGAMIGASTATLANPATGPRLTGFAVAPKQRNRAFHQLFRSVPEDDYLIEDYSCALQRDILLAGRIYISEGHICFSSNILGWVTTLVISFEEVVSFEKETTAMVFPNAIAIQTLHARHTFRSLLSREATFDLLIGIWKASHPAAFQKSINGKQMEQESQDKAETIVESEAESGAASEEEEDEVYDEDEDDDTARSFIEANGSIAGSDTAELKSITRKPSALNGSLATSTTLTNGEAVPAEKAAIAAAEAATDFPGPTTHLPTDCSDSATHYEKIIKDEIIPAPLGKIYSMLYGPASGVFVSKYLIEECKVTELVFEDDKKGLSNENKTRQYTYIKPLGGSIGPKQTKCVTMETLDAFDLERAVSVTCTTQTPDVPSGSSFSVKTRYCLSWAPNNATRLQMNCGIEWTAKSWLKGPIEKGANDGQQTYGNDLVKALKAAVSRPRAATTGSKSAKAGKKRRKGATSPAAAPVAEPEKREDDWGTFDFLRGPLGPVVRVVRPVAASPVTVGILFMFLLLLWFRGPSAPPAGSVGYIGYSSANRVAAYEEMWRKEESELWGWLEARVGLDGRGRGEKGGPAIARDGPKDSKVRLKQRQKILGGKDVEAKLNEERMSEREMEDAIRVTQERLHVLKDVMERRKSKQGVGGKP